MNPTLTLGSKGSDVKQIQMVLNKRLRPSPNLKPDGIFGKNTENTVRKFQAIESLGIDGVVGPKTWSALKHDGSKKTNTSPMILNIANSSWLKIARKESGQKEIIGSKHNNKIIQYHATTTLRATTDETPWCSSFVNWVLKEANINGTNSAAAASWLNWGTATIAKAGAIAVIRNTRAANSNLTTTGNHVGFLVKETVSHYLILGGNQSDQVKISSYPKKSWALRGYRWPNEKTKGE